MDATTFFIQQEMRKFESRCMSAIQVVRRAQTMWDVKRAADVTVPAYLRGVRLNRQGSGRLLEQEAEKRMQFLLEEQLKKATALPDIDQRRQFLGNLRLREWQALRGDFGNIYRKADIEGQRLLAKL